MPTFSAMALDRLLEPGTSKSVDKSVPSSNPVSKPKLPPKSIPVPKLNLERRNSIAGTERNINRPQMSPALYATPEATPLPDSPSSFSPSPYIINHKRRGPRLFKSFSGDNVSSHGKDLDEEKINGSANTAENEVVDSTNNNCVTFDIFYAFKERPPEGALDNPGEQGIPDAAVEASEVKEHVHGDDSEIGSGSGVFTSRIGRKGLDTEKDVPELIACNSNRDGDSEDHFDQQELLSYSRNIDGDENSAKLASNTSTVEFYDAWEELSSESGMQSSSHDNEAELCEMKLNLLMEIEKRKQAEETLDNAQNQWQRMKEQLALVGLTLPAFPLAVPEGDLSLSDPAEGLCQQVYLARFVSDSIGRGVAKAEVEMEKEVQIEAKNFEIARLWDRLHYYEAVNKEMSQRNQEAIEMSRRKRNVRKRRQRWVWGSITAVITLGTAALAWSYLPVTKGSSSSDSLASEHNSEAK